MDLDAVRLVAATAAWMAAEWRRGTDCSVADADVRQTLQGAAASPVLSNLQVNAIADWKPRGAVPSVPDYGEH